MKPTPEGWPRISTGIWYEDPGAAIDWLCEAFGFEVKMRIEGDDGSIVHSELVFDGGLIMVGGERPERSPHAKPPTLVGGSNTQNMMVFVDDVDTHCERARAAGAVITIEPETQDHGEEYWSDRTYECRDIGGHLWWFVQRMVTGGVPVE